MKKYSGFTLVELMVAVAILAVVVAVAAPPMSDFAKRYRSEAKGRELFEILILMRAKAYSEGRNYSLCPSGDGKTCGNDWSAGALLFADTNGNGKREESERIERVLTLPAGRASLSWNTLNKKYLRFRPNGTTPSQAGNFAYCPESGEAEYGWIIVLNTIGRPYFGKDRDGDGIVEDGSGKNLTCGAAS